MGGSESCLAGVGQGNNGLASCVSIYCPTECEADTVGKDRLTIICKGRIHLLVITMYKTVYPYSYLVMKL